MRPFHLAAFLAASALALGGCATSSPTPSEPVSGTIHEQTVTVTATVEKIDQAKRLVTLRGPDGKVETVKAGPEVRNLAQVQKGDTVVVTHTESLVYDVVKPGQAEPGVSAAAMGARAEPGQQPAAAVAQGVTVTSTIDAIDMDTPSVTLRSAEGELSTIKVRDRDKLSRVRVGDLVQITYAEALAISVQPTGERAK